LRRHVFDMAHQHIVGTHPVNFDALDELLLASMSEPWVMDFLTAADSSSEGRQEQQLSSL